jgi:hypothetical protein
MAMMNETYIRIFSGAASAALQEMIKRGGPIDEIADDAVDMALAFADRAIENDGVAMQDGTAIRLQVAAQLMVGLVPLMHDHTPWAIADRAVALAGALIERIELDRN